MDSGASSARFACVLYGGRRQIMPCNGRALGRGRSQNTRPCCQFDGLPKSTGKGAADRNPASAPPRPPPVRWSALGNIGLSVARRSAPGFCSFALAAPLSSSKTDQPLSRVGSSSAAVAAPLCRVRVSSVLFTGFFTGCAIDRHICVEACWRARKHGMGDFSHCRCVAFAPSDMASNLMLTG